MKLKTTIITSLLAINSLLAQTNDLFYKSTENKQTTDKNTLTNAAFSQGQKPFHVGIGDAIGIGVGYKINIGKDFSFGPGVHFGTISDEIESVSLLKISGLFRYKPQNAYFKIGPYLTFPLSSDYEYDMEEVFETPGFVFGAGYEFKNGFDIGIVQNIDLFFLDFDHILGFAPLLSVNYHFGEPKYTQKTSQKINQTKETPNYNLLPIEGNIPPKQETQINTVTDFSKYSNEELKKLLDQATAAEKYSEANDIQAEITKRTEQNKYAKLSTEELKKQLEAALKAEDYTKAEGLQKEIDKRASQKKDKTPDNSTKQPAKKSLKELEEDLKKAMDAEDFKKADEIQKEINKLKKP